MPKSSDQEYRHHLDQFYGSKGLKELRNYVGLNGNAYKTTPCFYCGLPATQIDHAYPLVALAALQGIGRDAPKEMLVKVPACRECNGMLSDSVHNTFKKRKKYVKDRIRKKYKKYLKGEPWGESEMAELGFALRTHIQAWEANRFLILDRLGW